MQSSAVNALITLVGGAGAPTLSDATAGDAESSGLFNSQFFQLLGDSGGSQFQQQDGAQQFFQGKLGQPSGLGVLAAQEVNPLGDEAALQIAEAQEQLITPQQAGELVKRLDGLIQANRDSADTQALALLRQQLIDISRGSEPKPVADIIAAVPIPKESKFSITGFVNLLSPKKPRPATEDQEVPEVADQLQQLSAAIFRPTHAINEAAATAARQSQRKEENELTVPDVLAPQEVTVFEPLNSIVLPQQAQFVPTESAVKEIPARFTESELDALIPPLKIATEDALPEVNLPKVPVGSELHKTDATAESFQSLAAKIGGQNESIFSADTQPVVGDKPSASLATTLNPSHSNGFSPTQLVHAAQPISVVPTPGFLNHAPVTDQVHVAIKQATKDSVGRMTIQLEPIELGRVEVSLQTNREGQTQIVFVVDKPETFDSLSRDARSLERALQESGIKADAGSMQFNLRQQPETFHSDANGQGGEHPHTPFVNEEESADGRNTQAIMAAQALTRNYIFNVREGVDISA